ncbi:hypothetical protein [Mycobacterium asiaticum]|uniref:Uncharacterized protein n=1 Tax=Mycobacterium asiaticum TaxID=1790 RepID=A0A1A3UES6_MYCAS|nr:hypothetical protein [Mycobacterium asiaticum]OBK22645.1 hypothetical protein A5635_21040 [Mycobacterium asiaticum]OBK93334.1 hypothetical protein A5645_20620 [Mycobacterium asiaticum]
MSTFKRYLGIQFMIFIFGIVGPIFLIMFFASQPDPQMRWAFWTGLLITYADIMIALAITKGTLDNDKPPSDVRVALAVAKRLQGKRDFGLDVDPSLSD